jgi:phage gpG-like protein
MRIEAGARVDVDLSPLEEALAKIAGSGRKSKSLEKKVMAIIRTDILRQFSARGIPAWEPLSQNTVRRKQGGGKPEETAGGIGRLTANRAYSLERERMLSPDQPLVKSGSLLSSWINPRDPDHEEGIDGTYIWVGSTLEYAATHQYGGRGFRDSTIPARPLTITSTAIQEIIELVEKTAAGSS